MLQRLQVPAQLDGMVWRYNTQPSANRRHHHAELELNLVIQGSGTYLLGGHRYRIQRGDLLWLFPDQEHVLMEQTTNFEMWVAVFKRRAIRRIALDPQFKPLLRQSLSEYACRRLGRADQGRLENLFSDLSAADQEPALVNAGLSYSVLNAWISFQRASEVPVGALHPAVEKAARLIQDETSALTLNAMARKTGLSASRLSRLFKQQTGYSIVRFRNRQRIERFRQIYESDPKRTVLSAALDAGFGSYPQFHRVFREVVGCSPSEYQRRALRSGFQG